MKFMKSLRTVLLGVAIAAATLIVGCTGIRARRLRFQSPSQCVGPMRMGRSKSKLVPESYGPSRHLRGPWAVALLPVIAFGAARRSAADSKAQTDPLPGGDQTMFWLSWPGSSRPSTSCSPVQKTWMPAT